MKKRFAITFLLITLVVSNASSGTMDDKLFKLLYAGKGEKDIIADVKELIEKGTDTNTKGKDGRTALMEAILRGYIETTKLLIKNGADVNTKDNNGYTALMAAEGSCMGSNLKNTLH